MSSRLNPYLGFRDTAREAMDFYQSVFGGEITRSTFGEFNASDDPAEKDKIMHSELTTTSGFSLMASDTPSSMELPTSSSVTVSLSGDDEAELTGYWEKLLEGGTATRSLSKAPWGDSFGMLVDKLGTSWMVNIAGTTADAASSSGTKSVRDDVTR
ncbi:PhnB protein [Cryobacterium flavum]|uniref:PhnB protein n=1 Tax=Cryobacterium flavum TaxID=1424659 RepID=A0A4R8UY10_9MICO|nr:VOC family protein [Cryobacterium flavum]TFB73104.1 VOC family protein [Cryobacterium flavum]SDM99066.1 PhnB protein [Cryobacterium flavum]